MHATIVAISTPVGRGGIGIIRVSGPRARAAAARVCRCGLPSLVPRVATRVDFAAGDTALDRGLILLFPEPKSFTGETVVELHTHGSPRLLQMLLTEILLEPGVRLAQPGEFSRRAVRNGQMDLAVAESVADIIAAESEAQVHAAAAQMVGALSIRVEAARDAVLRARATVDGVLEFPEETDGAEYDVASHIAEARATVVDLLAHGERGRLIRRGARIVIFGPANAGKSTLFNALVGVEMAIVDAEPGTTRDAIEATLEIAGLRVSLVDTAGLREGAEGIEQKGIERTRSALAEADIGILVIPPGASDSQIAIWEREIDPSRLLAVFGKADLVQATVEGDRLRVSGTSGLGIPILRELLEQRLTQGGIGEAVLVTSERHLDALRRAAAALDRAIAVGSSLELASAELRIGAQALAEILGSDASTELLDAVFARFCIGK